tara:strand:+ start:4803 stop:5051 length:249 start_codon:yes stop_codon:yes gene_type:complete
MLLEELEVRKMVKLGTIKSALTVSADGGHKLTFSLSELGKAEMKDVCLILVTQKKEHRVFKTLDAVREFLKRVGIQSFLVCG